MAKEALNKAKVIAKQYISSHDTTAMNIGGGSTVLKHWLNVDLISGCDVRWNLCNGLPFCGDNTFDFIYSEHCWEHLTYEVGIAATKECYRILKPGGVLRLSVPDLDYIVDAYVNNMKTEFPIASNKTMVQHNTPCKYINACFYGSGHKYMYNYDELSGLLQSAAFDAEKITREEYRTSKHEMLSNLETRKLNQRFLIVEATK